jgi:hypothetical protein
MQEIGINQYIKRTQCFFPCYRYLGDHTSLYLGWEHKLLAAMNHLQKKMRMASWNTELSSASRI